MGWYEIGIIVAAIVIGVDTIVRDWNSIVKDPIAMTCSYIFLSLVWPLAIFIYFLSFTVIISRKIMKK